MALENFKFYKIRLDRADMTIAAPLTAKEGAVNGNGIELQIINGSIIDDMTNIAVYLNWKHLTSGQQGSEPFVLYDLAKGIYRIHYPTEMLSLGTIRADIKVVDAQSVTVSTSEVLIKVAEAATDSTTQSENAWNDIQTILVNQQVISERLTELENGGIVGPPGADGNDGKSAYEIAVQNGFIGTEVEWLASIKGADGADGINGTDGKSTYQIALDNGFVGTEAQWLASLKGADGKSAYQSALDGGFVGTELQFNEALAEVNNKQEALVSGTNIKTINGGSILDSGNLDLLPKNNPIASGEFVSNGQITSKSSVMMMGNSGGTINGYLFNDSSGISLLDSTGVPKIKVNKVTGEVDIMSRLNLTNGQIKFPSTQVPSADPNTLTDYEKGDFSPTVTGLTTPGTGQTYTTQIGKYIKVGDAVQIWGKVTLSNKGNPTGGILLSNLPFSANLSGRVKAFISNIVNVTGNTVDTIHGSFVFGNSIALADNTGTLIDCAALTNTSQFDFYASYPVA